MDQLFAQKNNPPRALFNVVKVKKCRFCTNQGFAPLVRAGYTKANRLPQAILTSIAFTPFFRRAWSSHPSTSMLHRRACV